MAGARLAAVYVSITTLDPELARVMEPRAAAPQRRLRTIETLAHAGVPVGVSVSPVIPFLNEPELERILEAAARRRREPRLQRRAAPAVGGEPAVPAMAGAALPRARGAHHGARARDARRPRQRRALRLAHDGQGVWAQLLRQRFDKACARLGLNRERIELDLTQFQPPAPAAACAAGQPVLSARPPSAT